MGILSVKRAVEECKGDLCIDVQKGRFQVSVILPKQTANTEISLTFLYGTFY